VDAGVAVGCRRGAAGGVVELAFGRAVGLQAGGDPVGPVTIPAEVGPVRGDVGAVQGAVHPVVAVGVVAAVGLGVAQADEIPVADRPAGAKFDTVHLGFFPLHGVDAVPAPLQALAEVGVRPVVAQLGGDGAVVGRGAVRG